MAMKMERVKASITLVIVIVVAGKRVIVLVTAVTKRATASTVKTLLLTARAMRCVYTKVILKSMTVYAVVYATFVCVYVMETIVATCIRVCTT
jgi:hypothetical protein